MAKQKRRSKGIHIHVRPHEKETISEAADVSGQYISELVRGAALEAARDILDRESEPVR